MSDGIHHEDSGNISAKFSIIDKPQDHAPFRNLTGWKFDEGVWQTEEHSNNLFKLPLASDIDFSNVPKHFFKSGINGTSSLELEEINFLHSDLVLGWNPGVTRGSYWIFNEPDYIHSSESLFLVVGNNTTFLYRPGEAVIDPPSVRSTVSLQYQPDPTIPVIIKYLKRDENYAIAVDKTFDQVVKFTGIAVNGIEQDGDDYNNTDQSLDEFMIVKNDSDPKTNVPLILGRNVSVADSILKITLDDIPVMGWTVRFSRKDIFIRELPFAQWNAKRVDPTQSLTVGDYAVGYQGSSGEGIGIWLWTGGGTLPANLGTVSYQQNHPFNIIFNKDVRVAHSSIDLTESIAGLDGEFYFLPSFPVLDTSSFGDEFFVGDLELDTSCATITTGATEWTRVANLEDVEEGDDQNVFELNPLFGTIRFGNGGNAGPNGTPLYGARPDATVTASWTSVPYIQYDVKDSSKIFTDKTEDLDPLTNALKQGFLVLDNRRLTPWKIELTTNSPGEPNIAGNMYHGKIVEGDLEGLGLPPTTEADITSLKARVVAYGNPPQGIPNVPVEFVNKDGLLFFTQPMAVTDGDGYAYTEAFGKSNFNQFVLKIHLFDTTEEVQLNPIAENLHPAFTRRDPIITNVDMSGSDSWNSDEPDWIHNALIVPEQVTTSTSDIYLFVVSTPGLNDLADYDDDPLPADQYLTPYNSKTREGGLSKVWSYLDGAQKIVHPIAVTQPSIDHAVLVFDRPLPHGHLVMGYLVVIDRTATVEARTKESPILVSNQLNYYLSLNETMKGQWKLPNLAGEDSDGFHEEDPDPENADSSRIGTGIYLSPNDIQVSGFQDDGEVDITEGGTGTTILIRGTNFPVTEELKPSVFVLKISDAGRILSVKDITIAATLVNDTTIRIATLPAPPTGSPGNYYIAVSSYSESTAKLFTYTG